MTTQVMEATRNRFGEVLSALGAEDPNVVFVGGDLNKSVMSVDFSQKFPERFFDLGAAEQNMMSVAAGLASAGKIPFVSTFAVFATSRAFDQIRVGISQPGLNVKIVTTHAGIVTGEDGISAQAIEDVALMTALPSFTVIVPADAVETEAAVRAAAAAHGPFYIRLSRPATPIILPPDYQFAAGKAIRLREGRDVTIIACGIMTAAALEAADILAGEGVEARVLNMATIQPIDDEAIADAAADTGAIVTAEEHQLHGGLGSAAAAVVALSTPVPMEFVALRGYAESGKPEELLVKYNLTSADVADAARRAVSRKR